jgi:hypothetical protein
MVFNATFNNISAIYLSGEMMIQFHVHTNVYSLNSGHLTLPVMIFTSEIYDDIVESGVKLHNPNP